MKVITYRIHLQEPVLAKGLEGDPNSGVSYHFLPGSVLRGALIGQYLRDNPTDALMQNKTARQLFFNPETTRFLNGYLVCRHYEKTYRALPTPLSWHYCKLEKRPSRIDCDKDGDSSQLEHFDHAIQQTKTEYVCPEGDKDSWQQVKDPFCVTLSDQFALATMKRRISVHTARHRDYGRARADRGEEENILNGAVYRYEAIEAGQTFEAHILCQDEDVTALTDLIEGELLLGGARMAGYGRVSLKLTPPKSDTNDVYEAQNMDEWREFTPGSLTFDGVVITLLSDALLRDEHGQPQSTVAELSRQLGFTSEARAVFAAYLPIGGFNRKWGLPTMQQTALKMGTVLVFDVPSIEQMTALHELEKTGIGEQREDGFGRFAINWHTASSFTPIKLDSKREKPESLVGTTSEVMAQTIVNRLHRTQLDDQLREQAKKLADDGKMKMVSKTQLNRLRLQLQRAVHEITNRGEEAVADHQARLEAYRANLLERNHTRQQFEKARMDKRPFLDWLKRCIEAKEMPVTSKKSYAIGDVQPQTNTAAIRLEFNLRLVDLTLARIVKQRRSTPVQGGENE
jgi:CRISPR-associated protein Csx10